MTPYISVDLVKLENNARVITELCGKYGVEVAGVTKGFLGNPEMAKAMLRGGVKMLGDSRLANIERLKKAGINAPILLMRSPHLSEIERVVDLADFSLNTELEVVKKLSEASLRKRKCHKIILMVDLGDLREGLWPDELRGFVKDAVKFKGIEVVGIGANLTDLNGVLPSVENNAKLVKLATEIEQDLGKALEFVSAGNSSSLCFLSDGKMPDKINHFRIGEGILLGRESAYGGHIHGTFQDVFTLTAEVIECKEKSSVPIGEIGMDAFGNKPEFEEVGRMKRCILNLGKQDVLPVGISPLKAGLQIVGATSDHMIMDATRCLELKMGDLVDFRVNYAGMLSAMTSPFVSVRLRQGVTDKNVENKNAMEQNMTDQCAMDKDTTNFNKAVKHDFEK